MLKYLFDIFFEPQNTEEEFNLVRSNPENLNQIVFQSEAICLEAVKRCPDSVSLIRSRNMYNNIVKTLLETMP